MKYFNLLPSGEIQTKINIDRESLVETNMDDSITCLVDYVAGDTSKQLLIVTIDVEDVNDVVPSLFGLQHPVENLTIFENLKIGNVIRYLMPYDLDKGLNGTVNYTIIKGNEEKYFELRSPAAGGESSPDRLLYLNRELDYGQTPLFNLTLRIIDKGVNPLMSFQQIVIHVIDVNDQTPVFPISNFYFDVSEDHPVGKDNPFGRVNATDEDSAAHAQIFYQLSRTSFLEYGDLFTVNTTTGELYTLRSIDFDRDNPSEYTFSVEARNPGSASGTTAEIKVTIIDINDEKPIFKAINCPEKVNCQELKENFSMEQVFAATYTDDDKYAPNNEIFNVFLLFTPNINHTEPTLQKIGDISFIHFKIQQLLDREETPTVNLTIFVTDNGVPPQTSEETMVTFTVTDENDSPPQFTQDRYTGKVAEAAKPSWYVLTVFAEDPDIGPNKEFVYLIQDTNPNVAEGWFGIDPSSGDITLLKSPDYYAVDGEVELTVVAIDNGSNSDSTIVEISILPSVTFQPNSFHEYSGIDLIGSSVVYLELRTDRNYSNALLLYQYSNADSSPTSLQLLNNKIVYSTASATIETAVTLQQNKWYSILLNKTAGLVSGTLIKKN